MLALTGYDNRDRIRPQTGWLLALLASEGQKLSSAVPASALKLSYVLACQEERILPFWIFRVLLELIDVDDRRNLLWFGPADSKSVEDCHHNSFCAWGALESLSDQHDVSLTVLHATLSRRCAPNLPLREPHSARIASTLRRLKGLPQVCPLSRPANRDRRGLELWVLSIIRPSRPFWV